MAEDIASLRLRVDSLEAAVADKRLQNLARSGKGAERATDGLTASIVRFAGPAALAAGAVAGLTKTLNVTREFDVLNAQLITATGNAENAARAFVAIQDFATQTPYDLQQATEGFTKLVNLGLTPSERAMRSYGDTSAAMGKDLIQMVEAVADATTGEFERLKEFGIRSKKEGDQVSFTFRGVTETVKFSAEEIEEYLTRLGENNFAGAMEQRMKTLDGALSNFGDSWDKMFLTVSEQGIGDVMETTVRQATAAIEEFTAMMSSGQLEGYLKAVMGQFDGFVTAVADGFDYIDELWTKVPGNWKKYGDKAVEAVGFAFKHLPIEMETMIKLTTVELAVLVDYAGIYGKFAVEALFEWFELGAARAKVYGKAIAEAFDPTSDYDMEAELAKVDANFKKSVDNALAVAERKAEITKEARKQTILDIMAEREEAIGSFNAQIEGADKAREAWNKLQAARANEKSDRLAEFKVQPEGGDSNNFDTGAVEKLRLALRTEEEIIQESYDKRLAIILANTEEGSIQQNELKKRLDEQFATDALGDFAADDTFDQQLERINTEYEQRRELILNNVKLTEEQRTELEEKLTKSRNSKIDKLEIERTKMVLSASGSLFEGLADLAKNAAGEQSKTYKALFAVSKAFAIAESIINIQQGISEAISLGWPAMIPAITSVTTNAAGVISTIKGTEFSGAYNNGGYIPQGGVGLVGEFGPELVSGPAQVMGRKQTMDAVKASGSNTVVNIYNQAPGVELVEERSTGPNGEEFVEVVVQRVRDEFRTDIAQGGGDFSEAIESAYPSVRRTA